jgi:hypothetical protein
MSAEEQSDESEDQQKKDWHLSDCFHPSRCQSTGYERIQYWRSTAGNGESLTRIPVQSGEFILGDAIYGGLPGLLAIKQKKADVLIRVNPVTFVAFGPGKRRFPLLKRVTQIAQSGKVRAWKVWLRSSSGEQVEGRLCAIRKSEQAIAQAQRRLQRKEVRKQTKLKPETFGFARYVMVFTTYERGSAAQILQWYRMRWQIELVFKRLKSLLSLGRLPKYDARSSRVWLYGKLLVALLTQKLIRTGRDIPPGDTYYRSPQASQWREFLFALHQIQRAIEPLLPLRETLERWREIECGLAESTRKRKLQDLFLS